MMVSQIQLHRDTLVVFDNQHYKVLTRDSAGVTMRTLGAHPISVTKSHQELSEAYFGSPRRLTLVRETISNLPEPQRLNIEQSIESFDIRWQNEALRRLDYVQGCDRSFADKSEKRTIDGYSHIARMVAQQRRDRSAEEDGVEKEQRAIEKVGGSTVRRWHRFWKKGGYNALIPAHDRKGRTGFRLDPEVEGIISEIIRQDWLTLEGPPLSHCIGFIEGRIESINRTRTIALPIPCDQTVRRWVSANVSKYDEVFFRKGAAQAAQLFKDVKRSPQATHPLEVVEIDHTPLDVLAVHSDGSPVRNEKRKDKKTVRAWLTLAICAATRMIVGFYISTERPSWTSVMNCLRMAVLPKDLSKLEVRTTWPVFGVPSVIVLDNGREFHSRSMQAAAGQLRIEIRYMPRGKPHLKGKVERAIGTVARDFVAYLPGRTFRDVRERGDYDSVGRASLTIEQITEMFTIWVVDVYHNRPHGGLLGRTPLQRWEDLSGYGVRLPPSADDLDPLIALVVDRTIQRTGITFLGLTYRSDELKKIRRRPGFHFGQEFLVKVDPADIGTLMVLDPASGWIDVPCDDPRLSSGTSLLTWREAVQTSKKMTREGQPVARSTMLQAMMLLRERGRQAGARPTPFSPTDFAWCREHVDDVLFEVSPDPADEKTHQDEASRTMKKRRPGRETGREHSAPSPATVGTRADQQSDRPPTRDLDTSDLDLDDWSVE